jgi:hypothetical protein
MNQPLSSLLAMMKESYKESSKRKAESLVSPSQAARIQVPEDKWNKKFQLTNEKVIFQSKNGEKFAIDKDLIVEQR